MDLAARLQRGAAASPAQATALKPVPPKPGGRAQAPADGHAEQYHRIKTSIHERLIDVLDLSLLDSLPEGEMRVEIARVVERILWEDFAQAPLNAAERSALLGEIQDEVLGLGPLGAAFFLWDAALKRGDARKIGLLSFITPLLSTLLLLTARGETPGLHVLAAAVLIVGAAVVGTRAKG